MFELPGESVMYQALLDRDPSYDGLFLVGVKTTGIFCRPTCSARKPERQNVEFFASTRDALHAGYRPCKRCRPMDASGSPPEWVTRLMSAVERGPGSRITDADLQDLSIEPARARRYFKQHYGMTFQAYQRARRMGLALADVRAGRDLSAVGLRHGYESSSGFREAFARVFGRPPGHGRNADCLLARWLDTPLGAMLAVANDEGLCLLEFVDRRALESQVARLRRRLQAAVVPGDNAQLDALADELARYFDGTLTRFSVQLVLTGTPFQRRIWRRLLRIPPGETRSYAQLAVEIGRPGAHRAVGRANGQNRIAIIVPCHRVVRSDGSLCGYGGGLWRKQWLLEHERKHASAVPRSHATPGNANPAARGGVD